MGRMENENIDETRPVSSGDETIPSHGILDGSQSFSEGDTLTTPVATTSTGGSAPVSTDPPGADYETAKSSPIWGLLILLSILALIVIAAASAYGGYRSGINQRTSLEATLVAQEIQEQFELGIQDVEAGRYEVARQRFEYVIQLKPNYPGVTEKLTEVLLELNITATPTTAPSPTLTPTVDLRGAEELFSQAQMMLVDQDWSGAIDTLLKLRKDEPSYKAIDIDSMLYVALRNRGVKRILNQADLEGGTYDLALAEKFGPLDVEANNYRIWADLYVTGVSFWELDWGQASYYFSQIILVAPNLRDSSNMTATERYRIATLKYADTLTANNEWCKAQEQYQAALTLGSDPIVEPTATWVTKKCERDSEEDEDD